MKNNIKSKRAALEMSVGTMVTLVLLMVFLVMGIFFIQKVGKTGYNAIDTIDTEMQNQIQQLFGSDNVKRVAMFPTSQRLTLKQGDRDKGFGFFIRNLDQIDASFTYDIRATDTSTCPSLITEEVATGYLIGRSGTTTKIGSGQTYQKLTTFIISETAPLCTIEYELDILREDGQGYANLNFFVTIK
jgi:hypothetical protein